MGDSISDPDPTPFLLGEDGLDVALDAVKSALAAPTRQYFSDALKARYFPGSDFVGPYEEAGIANGTVQEQWLWQRRSHIRGTVLDMSTPRYLHEFVYRLDDVDSVLISDLDAPIIDKFGHSSEVDVIGDFCAPAPPMAALSVDTVLSLSVIEHCTDPFAFVRNLHTVLRPGGVLFLWAPFAYLDGHLSPDYWRFCADGYALLCEKAGLEMIELGSYTDMGKYFLFEYGQSRAAQADNRGTPASNWCLSRRPA